MYVLSSLSVIHFESKNIQCRSPFIVTLEVRAPTFPTIDDHSLWKNPFAAWKNVEDGEDGAAPNLKGARWFSFDDIKRMTNSFNDGNVLGAGGYGKSSKCCPSHSEGSRSCHRWT